MSPTNSRSGGTGTGTGSGAGEEMKRSGSAASSTSSSTSALKGTEFDRSQSTNGESTGGGGAGGSPTNVRKMATRGRIGLAGAGARIGGGRGGNVAASSSGRSEVESEAGEKAQESTPSNDQDEGKKDEGNGEQQDLDSIPVFKGFGADRPHGRIPIPMEKITDPETGEEKMVAKQPRNDQ